jgi:hypothetical protein
MKILSVLAVAGALLTAALAPASAQTVKISEDRGGVIVDFVKSYSNLRDSGGSLVIDGDCMSACTLFIGIVRPENVCATDRAALGFHSATAYKGGDRSKPYHAAEFSALMWNLYPQKLREKLTQLGWLGDDPTIPHPNFVILRGKTLFEFVRQCTGADAP